MVFLKKLLFSNFFFFELIQSRKGCFRVFYNNKALFLAINRRSLKSRKIEVFSKLLIHGFFKKKGHFPINFLGNGEIFKKPEKSKISLGFLPQFLSKIGMFSQGYFQGKSRKKSFFSEFLSKKECFLDQKIEVLKISKKSKLSKNFPIFQNIVCFLTGIFRLNKAEKILFFYILHTLESLLDQKSEILKKSEKSKFS